LGNSDAKDFGQAEQNHHHRILDTTFYSADIIHCNAGFIRQGLLRQVFSKSSISEVEPDEPQDIHADRQGDYSLYFYDIWIMDIRKVGHDRQLGDLPLPPLLESFLDYWAARLIDERVPVRNGDFSPASLRPWLGYLALIERDGDRGLRFRLAGTNLHARFQAELTGRKLGDVESDIVGDLEDRVQRAMSLQSPLATEVISADGNRKFVDLILPLANEAGTIDLVILASCPADQPALTGLN
jgi:hypothetical protein